MTEEVQKESAEAVVQGQRDISRHEVIVTNDRQDSPAEKEREGERKGEATGARAR